MSRPALLSATAFVHVAQEADVDRALREANANVIRLGVQIASYDTRFADIWDYLRDGPQRRQVSKAASSASARIAARSESAKAARSRLESARRARARVGL